jgi:hypothetical protein
VSGVRPTDAPELPADVAALCGELKAGLRMSLDDALASVYLYGALAFPHPKNWAVDVDFHALLSRSITDDERDAVRAMHRRLADASALGKELDGYYILMADAARSEPPVSQAGVFPSASGSLAAEVTDEAWALHRAHVLAGRFALLHGDDPRGVLLPPTWKELEHALHAEMAYIDSHSEHPAYGILNACRILYSFRSRDIVISKYAAARWGMTELPTEWRQPIAAAVRLYSLTANADDLELVRARRGAFVAYIKDELHR